MQREANSTPRSRPVHDAERYRSADQGTRPVGSSPGTRTSANYEWEPELAVTGADLLREAGVEPAPASGYKPNAPQRKRRA